MDSYFNIDTGEWEVNWPDRVSRHDLVYLSPPFDPLQGIALGSGVMGAICWCEESRLIFAINRCDLWDDFSTGKLENWNIDQEEKSTTLRHACRLIIDFGQPVFDLFYINSFNAKLSLADSSMTISLSGPFGSIGMKCFIDIKSNILSIKITSCLQDQTHINVILERYGSRTFSHYYRLIRRDSSIGLDSTMAHIENNAVHITHMLSDGFFAASCKIISEHNEKIKKYIDNRHRVVNEIDLKALNNFMIVLSVTPPVHKSEEDAILSSDKAIDDYQKMGVDHVFKKHSEFWEDFWKRSYMESGDDYLDNLWHLTMYYAGASQRGRYPGRFVNGLWGWNRDVQPWNFYFHWNQQELYWPLNAAGHHDLIESYLNFRFFTLDKAKMDAMTSFRVQGAVVSDVCDRNGINSSVEFINHTPVAQIALDFWRQYIYTCNKIFLIEKALPYLVEAASFFETLFTKEADGKWHARGGTAYEGGIILKDSITELSCGKALFLAVLNALHEANMHHDHEGLWSEISNCMVEFQINHADERFIMSDHHNPVYLRGEFKGEKALTSEIITAGYDEKANQHMTAWEPVDDKSGVLGDRDSSNVSGIFPTAESSAIFPSGIIGISESDNRLYKAAVNSMKLYSPECCGWDPVGIALARLGLAEEVDRVLDGFPSRCQDHCNGFGQYGPASKMNPAAKLRFKTNMLIDVENPEDSKIPFYEWPLRYFLLESMSVLSCMMNEMLIQSYDGNIRIGPASSRKRDSRFTLHASGGFEVSAEIIKGEVLWIAVRNIHGRSCHVYNPWPICYMFINKQYMTLSEEALININSRKGDLIMIVPKKGLLDEWHTKTLHVSSCEGPKYYKDNSAMLGLPRMY